MTSQLRRWLPICGFCCLLLCASFVAAATKHAAEEKGIKSIDSGVASSIRFVNKSGQPIKIYWLDSEGTRKPYGGLNDGETKDQSTYMAHPWLITDDNDNAWYVYMTDAQPHKVEIVSPFGQ